MSNLMNGTNGPNESNRINSTNDKKDESRTITFMFSLPFRLLKPGFNINQFMFDLLNGAPFLSVKLISCQICAPCLNFTRNGPLFSLELATSFLDLPQKTAINQEILYIILVTFAGSDSAVESFFEWWQHQVIASDYHFSISLSLGYFPANINPQKQ